MDTARESARRIVTATWRLTDLGSADGTRVNGWRLIGTAAVRAGDQVTFGSADFVLADSPP